MYDPELIRPFREELTRIGAKELLTAPEVDAWLAEGGSGLLVINSVCGCAAGSARPGVGIAMQHPTRPERFATVFAGQDKEATAQARAHFADVPPSSPSIALVVDGKLVDFLPRHRIERRMPQEIAQDLVAMFEKHLAAN
ncbi:MAG: BrxA/BrxB family bacilliredoxin [Planctomycetes bacterium]|nr:BrxA/BrxB family bacilliredoxin [Planctomycetota bacterium]MCB9886022.1 BrxA/BrxB family bacilliredoxin [Planctomycetota bacterium]